MEAKLTNYRQSPRKVRLIAGLVTGKTVSAALRELAVLPKRAASPVASVIKSAAANAEANFKVPSDQLVITSCTVDKGRVLKRSRPMSRGRAFVIHKHSSHVVVKLGEAKPKAKKAKAAAKSK